MLQNRVLDGLICSSYKGFEDPISVSLETLPFLPSQNIHSSFIYFFDDVSFGKGESASVAPGLGIEVSGGWGPNFSVLG